jgi:hypothetical protein
MRSIARGIVVVGAVGLVSAAGATQASAATVKRFAFTGGQQFFAVPDGVTSLHVVAIGGRGGTGAANTTSPGGFGGVATADVKVTPGAILLVNVGGNGASPGNGSGGAGGYNGGGAGGTSGDIPIGKGGGGGGGLSEIRDAATPLNSVVVAAAGGGGSGGGTAGGAGGPAAVSGINGGAGGLGAGAGGGAPGTGATGTVPGTGGGAGLFGVGGAGQNSANLVAAGSAGGGGGGLQGGGGAVTGSGGGSNGGGGGAGSGWFHYQLASNSSYVADSTGVPSVTLTYEAPTAGGGTQGGGGTNGGGGSNGGGSPNSRPVISALKLSPTAFVAAERGGPTGGTDGTKVTYRNAGGSTTTFTIQRRKSGARRNGRCVARNGRRGSSCPRYVSVGSFIRTDAAGFNTFTFTGRIRGRALAPGRYRLLVTSRADGRTSTPVTIAFRIAE